MKVTLDPTRCDGFGYCAEICPEVITLDEWGFPVVRKGPLSGRSQAGAREAARACPRRALEVLP